MISGRPHFTFGMPMSIVHISLHGMGTTNYCGMNIKDSDPRHASTVGGGGMFQTNGI
jgi:hypothetical protein